MKKLQAIALIFRISCLLLFLSEAWKISKSYLQMETYSQTRFVRKEDYPLPLICVTTKDFIYDGFNNSLNITHDEYTKGKWNFEGYSVREIWDFLSPDMEDLVRGVKIENTTSKYSDKYAKIRVSTTNLNKTGIDILGKLK